MKSVPEKLIDWIMDNIDDTESLIKYMLDELHVDELQEYVSYSENEMFDIVNSKANETGNIFIDMLLQMTPGNSIASMFCHSFNDLRNNDNNIRYVSNGQYFIALTDSEVVDNISDDAYFIADKIWQYRNDIFETLPEGCELYDILYDECYVEPDIEYDE